MVEIVVYLGKLYVRGHSSEVERYFAKVEVAVAESAVRSVLYGSVMVARQVRDTDRWSRHPNG